MLDGEPILRIETREELICLLAEAAAFEHNVMCCYLYGICSLKRCEQDGLTPEYAQIVASWKAAVTDVSVEEMTHLTLVGNLSSAIGDANLPDLSAVTDLASAEVAIETIIEQREGAPEHSENSHYSQLVGLRAQLDEMLAADPDFEPAILVARNLVMQERIVEMVNQATIIFQQGHSLDGIADTLMGMVGKIVIPGVKPVIAQLQPHDDKPKASDSDEDTVGCEEGRDMVLSFDTKRSIHARSCVLGAPVILKPEPLVAHNGSLSIMAQNNGPLQASGNLEICAGTGRNIDRVQVGLIDLSSMFRRPTLAIPKGFIDG